jgi:hypothetical protein
MRAREDRFVGNGNTWVADGHYRGWKITCARCGNVKVVTGHNGNSLPPNIVAKKFVQAGWYLANKPTEDVCGDCRRKAGRKAARVGIQTTNAPTFHYTVDAVTSDFAEYVKRLQDCLGTARKALESKQHNRALGYVDAALRGLANIQAALTTPRPAPPPKPVQAAAPTVKSHADDPDYDRWLASQEQLHRLPKDSPQ